MICGVYAEKNEQEILTCTKGYAEQSANIFQRKLIDGIKNNKIEYKIISAPLIGAYPMRYKKSRFYGFSEPKEKCQYISFCNVWGVRNISRTSALKKAIRAYFLSEPEESFCILVYCPHTPFLEAAIYAKNMRPESKICLVVPDLPQYMNLNEKRRGLYDFFKAYDIRHMEKFIAQVDSFVLLTEPMKDILNVGSRPYLVVEGLIAGGMHKATCSTKTDGVRRIVYTGKMNLKFGIKMLVDSFMKIKDPDYRLILCGDGDAREYVQQQAKIDHRIEYRGMVTMEEARTYIEKADVLVNPRPNTEEYTKYSFPSKNIEYLMTGKPVVAYMLDGMPQCYRDFLYVIPDDTCSFENILIDACNQTSSKLNFESYAKKNLDATYLIAQIIGLSIEDV